jgi:hypothetical protein
MAAADCSSWRRRSLNQSIFSAQYAVKRAFANPKCRADIAMIDAIELALDQIIPQLLVDLADIQVIAAQRQLYTFRYGAGHVGGDLHGYAEFNGDNFNVFGYLVYGVAH